MNITHLQLWPRGTNVSYSGSYPHYVIHEGESQRPATERENRDIQANCLAQNYHDRDLLCNDSSLITDLTEKEFEGFTVDDIEGIYANTSEWTLQQCYDYIAEHGDADEVCAINPWVMTRDEMVEYLNSAAIECYDHEDDATLRTALIENINDDTIDGLSDWRECAQEFSNDNPQEPLQWWRVSDWLGQELKEIGEVVIDNGYGWWWGRTCCGQGVLMDGTLQNIAHRHLSQ